MFETAEIGAHLAPKDFAKIKDGLRLDLLALQQQCREAKRYPVIVVVSGVPGAGLIDTLNLLNTWMDPRWIATHAFDAPSDEERERPTFWRYWRALPEAGRIGLFLNGWYEDPIREVATRHISQAQFRAQLERAAAFERMLADDGALIMKFWLHLGKAQLRKRAPARRRDSLLGLRPTDSALTLQCSHETFVGAGGAAIAATDQPNARWHIIEGVDDVHRRAAVLRLLRDTWADHSARLASARKKKRARGNASQQMDQRRPDLSRMAMPTLSERRYEAAFHRLQRRLYDVQTAARAAGLSTVLVFEGWDAAGKGGAIRRLTYALNARNYRVIPIGAPTAEELAHHYLWRFWRELPRAGRIAIFDRSWYGRVLVERVEKLIAPETWQRAYDEINAFERQLTESGVLVLKFWLHITPDEQLTRFKARAKSAHKRWKLTPEDWRNRAKWDAYTAAVADMTAATSPAAAPWHLIPANDKRYARVEILKYVLSGLEGALRRVGRKRRAVQGDVKSPLRETAGRATSRR